jgi:hypothetical protein
MGACLSSLDQTAEGPRGLPCQTGATSAKQSASCRSAGYQTTPTKTVTSQVLPDGSRKVATKTETRNSDGSISVTVVESVNPAGIDDTPASWFASEAETCVRAQPVPGSERPPPVSPDCVSALDQAAGKSRGSLYQPEAVKADQSASYRFGVHHNTPTKTVTSQVMPDGSKKVNTKTETRNSDGSITVNVVESVKPARIYDTTVPSFASETERCVHAQSVPGSVRPPSVSCVRAQSVPSSGSRFLQAHAPYLQSPHGPTQASSGVFAIVVNGVTITGSSKVALLASGYLPGRYWRDFTAGFYGREGGPTLGVSQAPIPGAGPLQPDASCQPAGQTNIFINGREVHPTEVTNLLPIMMQPGGRWRLDSQMNVYQEDNGMFVGSLRAILANFHQVRGGGAGLGGVLKGSLSALVGDDGGGGGGDGDVSGWGGDWSGDYNPNGTSWACDGDGSTSWYDAGSFFMDS